MPADSPTGSDPNSHLFYRLFCEHWSAGTGLAQHDKTAAKRDGCWTIRTFSDAMGWAGLLNIDPTTIQSWRMGRRWPQQIRKDAILKVFFRIPSSKQPDDAIQSLRRELEDAWQDGQVRRSRDTLPRDEDVEPEPPKRWLPAGKPSAILGLASVRVSEPQPGNEPGSGWFVKARLHVRPAEYERRDGTPVFIAVKEALLTITTTGYQVATRSVIGQQGNHPNFRPETDNDSVAVIGPALGGCLEGDLAGDETLAQVVPIAEAFGEEIIGVSLHAFRRSFVVSLRREPLECVGSEEKQAVLNLFIELARERDAQGRVLLAHDSVRRTTVE